MSEFCCKDAWAKAKEEAWLARTLGDCRCDHNEACAVCWPLDFRKGGKWDKYVEPTVVNEACVDVARLQVSNEHLAAGLAAADEEVARLRALESKT